MLRRVAWFTGWVVLAACGRGAPVPDPPTPPPAAAAPGASAEPPAGPELVEFPSGRLTLHGFLHRPPGPGPFPAIVFNHGSEQRPGWSDDQAKFYVEQGFVLFVPHRRGHGQSRDAGEYIGDLIDRTGRDSPALVEALVEQTDDVMAAVAYLAAQPYVDPTQIAAVGCSFGGIEALLAAERGTGLVAAVDFAGASFMWRDNAPLRERMTQAARNAKVPVFFIQAENDANTAPSQVLSQEMKNAGKPMRIHIFPPRGTTAMDGHAFCLGGTNPPWGVEVLAFLTDAMKR